jgi:UDP-3-O-[3-hydroxymyristoyl] glucosamine N-acyltransferase
VNITLKKISEKFNVEFIGDGSYEINSVSSITSATEKSIIFLSDKNFLKFLDETKSQTVVTTKELSKFCKNNIIICDNPYLLFAKISQLINKQDSLKYNVHSSVVSSTKNLNNKLLIEPNVVIGKNVEIEENSFIGANCYIGDNVKIASGARIFPNVTIYNDVKIGNNIIIHSGVVIGADGFGFANDREEFIKIPQIGGVRIGDNVEIGSNTSIDRGTLDNTIIGNGVKIDNQIQIAHNVHIGDNTAIAGCVGIAGSARIGKNCIIGGMAGIQGHIEICDNVKITGMAKVACDIKEPGIYSSGTPLMLNKKWLKNAARFKQLNELFLKYKNK